MALPSLTLQSAASATAPFAVGHAFKQGDIPAGQSVLCAGATSFQCDAKNAWADGSLKFAILSGTAVLTANTPLPLALTTGSAAGGTALTTADLKATGITASVDAGAFGSVTWATTDWDSPATTWISGPVMSSWMYRKAVGGDAHLVAWLEVRLFATGAVEVLPWIENGYINVASPSNKSETYAFTLGGTQRYSGAIDLKHHQRTPLINGSALSYWLGTDPAVTPLHDREYLKTTEMVPTYFSAIAANSTKVTSQVSTFAPLQAGGFVYSSDDMTSTSYQAPIGLLPEHDVIYLQAPSSVQGALWGSVNRNGYSAGRYGIHYRDENTFRPLRFADWPALTIRSSQGFAHAGSSYNGTRTPVVTGGAPPSWDTAHSPSVGYVAYLLAGRYYFLEEVQFAATVNYLGNGSGAELRDGAKGLVQPCPGAWQVRAAGWMWRTLTQAQAITPDADTTLQTQFKNSVQSNIDHFHGRYVAQANNPFGFVQNAAGYTASYGTLAAWQQDFVTAAFGYSMCMGLPLDAGYSAKLTAFFNWTAQSIVGRLSAVGGSGFPFIDADPYVLSISTASLPDWTNGTGPWRADWAEVFSTLKSTLQAASAYPVDWIATTGNALCGEIMPGAFSMWGNLMPAISYAVRHGVSGASAGLERVQGASNYSALVTDFNTYPVWSVEAAYTPSASTAMGKTLRIDTSPLISGMLVIGDTGRGVLGSIIRSDTATGDHGAGVLYNDWDSSADDNSEFRALIVTPPSAGSFFMYEDGSFELTGAPDGAYSLTYRLFVDGVDMGTATDTITVGSATTSVTADLSSNFNVRSAAQQSLASNFSIRAALQADSASAFSILTATIADKTSSFGILTPVQASVSSNFSIRSSAQQEQSSAYNVRSAVITDLSSAFNISFGPVTSQVIADLISSFSIRSAVQRDLTTYFNIGQDGNTLAPTGGFSAKYKAGTRIRKVYRTQLPTKDPNESVLVEFDFSAECVYIANPRFEVTAYRGVDADPEAIVSGAVIVSGAKAYQRFAGGLSKVQYGLLCIAETNDGDTLAAPAILPVKNKLAH